MLIWQDDDLASVDAAVSSVLKGQPRLVIVHGGPGSGRTSFLASTADRARTIAAEEGTPFSHWSAEGTVKSDLPLQGLIDLGILLDRRERNPVETERELREALDDALDSGPLLITIDDLQWIDPESVTAIVRVVESAIAEKLLIVVTTGYFEPFQHPSWQRLASASPFVVPVELAGLSFDDAMLASRDLQTDISELLVRRLWEHTRGNPLFLTSLIRRNSAEALERMVQLPAPDEYARAIELRLATLGAHAIVLARAAAVIGSGWMPLVEATHVAEIDDAAESLDVLILEYILEQRSTELGTEIRFVHAVIQASVYQNIPAAERIRLHNRAADVASDELGELRHLYAAATTYDADLADRLDAVAATQHDQHSHRTAAEFLDWACRLTANGRKRSERWSASLYERLLAGSIEFVRDALPQLRTARDRRGAALVVGTLHVLDNEWREAIAVLGPFANTGDSDRDAYRIEILLAWASMAAGEETDIAMAPLGRAEAMSQRDDSLAGLATFTAAMLERRNSTSRFVQERLGVLPERPAAVPLDDTYWLAWRGFAAIMSGHTSESLEPLREVQTRMATGLLNVGDGLTNAFLGLGHWFAGDVGLAATQFRIAEKLLRTVPNPMTASYAAVGHIITGDREGAMRLLNSARATLREMPWTEGVCALLVGSVAVLHALGTDEERADLMPGLRREFGDKADRAEGSPLWKMHAALACVWANDLDEAEEIARSLESTPDIEWGEALLLLIQGIGAWSTGDLPAAADYYRRSVNLWPDTLSVIAAHTAFDLSRVSAAMGDHTGALTAATLARTRYVELHAVPYMAAAETLAISGATLEPLTASARDSASGETVVPVPPAAFGVLSDRERDVAALVVRGMSYAQIARELFISRSTVGFHLTRIYAKTGTNTRHELSELVRSR